MQIVQESSAGWPDRVPSHRGMEGFTLQKSDSPFFGAPQLRCSW